eukprot:scaffold1306_cov100-Cylindrotheca_fusiformis.AAC.4
MVTTTNTSSSSTWFTTKKTPAQVERDRQIAKAAARTLSKKKKKNNNNKFQQSSLKEAYSRAKKETQKKAKNKKKKRKLDDYDEEEDDEELMDDEISYADASSSDDEEASFHDDDEDDEEDDFSVHDDDDDDDEIASPPPTTTRKPSKDIKKKKKLMNKKKVVALLSSEEEEEEASFHEDDDDDEEEEEEEVFSVHDDDDDEEDIPSPKAATTAAAMITKKSSSKEKKQASNVSQGQQQQQRLKRPFSSTTLSDDSDDDDSSSLGLLDSPIFQKKHRPNKPAPLLPQVKTTTAAAAAEDDDEEEDGWMVNSPSPPKLIKKKKKKLSKKKKMKKTFAAATEPSVDSSNPFSKFAANNKSAPISSSISLSDNDDDDDDMAMAIALSKSIQNNNNNNNDSDSKKSATTIWKEEPLEESSSSDEEQEPDVDDQYDEEKEAATNVLQTAETLSAHVMSNMTAWLSSSSSSSSNNNEGQDNNNNNNATAAAAAHGMIMMIEDGALALGNASSSSSESKNWISCEIMKEILPNVTLSTYQLIGVNWLALLHGMECTIEGNTKKNKNKRRKTNVNGILADEMGLGKTVQTIAFLAYLRHQQQQQDDDDDDGTRSESYHAPPHLIVVPVSVLPNWVREFETFAPELNVVKYHGSMAEREEIQEDLRQYLPRKKKEGAVAVRNKKWSQAAAAAAAAEAAGRHLDVILAPVTYFQNQKSDDRRFLNKFQFDYLVVDEAHMLKNAQSTRYKMLDRIKTRHRLLLTGTPVQNSPQELLNMLCFLMPLFSQGGNSDNNFDDAENGNASQRMLQHFVEHELMMEGGDEAQAYKKLKQLFAPFVLRRKKSDVISQLLPPKEQVVEFVDLDPSGRTIYENILAAHVNKNGASSAAIGEHLFTNLRKAANHPLLLRTRHTSPAEIDRLTEHFQKYGAFQGDGSTKERIREELSKFNDFHIHLTALELIDENPHRRSDLERYILPEEALFSSAKFLRLRQLLPQLIADGHRILIFSVWTSCLDLLGCLVEHLGLKYLRMDGSTASNDRQEMIDRFNRDDSISIFLLSTKACGLGINLTAADTCIIHDLDFNPFNDLQAEDRCHRIGQKKKVTVYKMVTNDTVDSDIYSMQERKSKMNAAIMESRTEKKERRELLENAVQRFLGSPKGGKTKMKAGRKHDKENTDLQREIIDIV